MNDQVPYVEENVIDPAASLNVSLRAVNSLLQVSVIEVGTNIPPPNPLDGDTYIVGDSPENEWIDNPNRLVRWQNEAWRFYDARYVVNLTDGNLWARNELGWFAVVGGGGGGGAAQWGSIIGTLSNQTDLQNRLVSIEESIASIPGGTSTSWGSIIGSLPDQVDLENRFLTIEESIENIQPQATVASGLQNRIINGSMVVSQRGTSFTQVANGSYTVDRFMLGRVSTNSFITISRNFDTNDFGSPFSLKVQVTTADPVIQAASSVHIAYSSEGFLTYDMVGVPITLQFRVKCSKPGVYCVSFRKGDNAVSFVSEYVVNSSDVWQDVSITLPEGLDPGQVWEAGASKSLMIVWCLKLGSTYATAAKDQWTPGLYNGTPNQTNLMGTLGSTFQIKEVQLKKGSGPTEFEFRPYPVELSLCQRYFEQKYVFHSSSPDTKYASFYWFSVKRASPTLTAAFDSGVSIPSYAILAAAGFYQYTTTPVSGSGVALVTGNAEL